MNFRLNKKSIVYGIEVIIFLVLLFAFGAFPPIGPLSSLDMRILGIFLGLIFGYSCLGFIWPSLIGLVALGLSGYSSMSEIIASGFGNTSVTVFVFLLLIFSDYINQSGLSRYIAHWFISKKIAIGRPYVLLMLFLLCAYVLGALISMFAAMFLLWNIFYKICDIVGFQKGDSYPKLVLIGIVYSASVGYALFPFKATQVVALNTLIVCGGPEVDAVAFSAINIILGLACIFVYLLLCKFVFRPDVTQLKQSTDFLSQYRNTKLDKPEKVAMLFLCLFLFSMFAPTFLPDKNPLGSVLNTLGSCGCLVLILGVMILCCRGKDIEFSFSKSAKSMNWDIIIMFAAIMPISSAIGGEGIGIIPFIVDLLDPVFSQMGPVLFSICFVAFVGVLTIFTPDLILAAMIPPVLYGFCVQLNVDARLIVTLCLFATSVAIATPSSSSMSAIIFANKEWIDTKSAYKYCCITAIASILVIIILGFAIGGPILALFPG